MSKRINDSIIDDVQTHSLLLNKREVFLCTELEDEDDAGLNYISAIKFLKNLRLLESISKDPIIVHQYSIGGEWCSGMMIFDAIKNSPCYITVLMHGCAMSMGSIIPQAADLRIIMPSCSFMIHRGSIIFGNISTKQFSSWHDVEKSREEWMLNLFAERCSNGLFFLERKRDVRRYIENKLDKKDDWVMTAEESVYYGFVDDVFGHCKYKTIEDLHG